MSGYNTSDQEQIQMLKDWWKKYGATILTGLLVFFVANFSWSFWKNYKQRYTSEASWMYTQMLSALQMKKNEEAQVFGDNLVKNYSRTPYASLAELWLAKEAVEQNKLDTALTQLQWVMQHASNDNLKQIARLRAARILLANNKNAEALNLLQQVDDEGYKAAIAELRGDILLAQDKQKEAIAAYQEALSASKEESSFLLKMKLERLDR